MDDSEKAKVPAFAKEKSDLGERSDRGHKEEAQETKCGIGFHTRLRLHELDPARLRCDLDEERALRLPGSLRLGRALRLASALPLMCAFRSFAQEPEFRTRGHVEQLAAGAHPGVIVVGRLHPSRL